MSLMIDFIYQTLPFREAGLLAGMLLGDKSGFDNTFYENLKQTGLIHLVVVSGTNVMLISKTLIENLAKYLGRKRIIILTLFIIWWYVGISGWEIPVVRAAILVSIFYWAQILGRKYNIGRGFGLTVLIMILFSWQIIKEVSFWLSFMAFFGVISVDMVFKPDGKKMCMREEIILQSRTVVWVSLLISPILALIFGKISLISPISNVLVLVLVETITLVGFAGTLIGIFLPIIGEIILWAIYPMLKYMAVIIDGLGSMNWVSANINFNWWLFWGWYLIIFSFILKRSHEK
ncbi:MAG: ComEC/Rec2 family competence protein [Candidatus Shapirobacteria bacterium]|nr:ComEC/Rec2 family competence protein [Candidatus Shapirobacteria bacterium]